MQLLDSCENHAMRGGKSILGLALGFFIVWLVRPVWQWYLDRLLDALSKAHGSKGAVDAILSLIVPDHPFLLGIVAGLIIALLIGYWGVIGGRFSAIVRWIAGGIVAPLMILWELFRQPVILAKGVVEFHDGEMEKTIPLPKGLIGTILYNVETGPHSTTQGYLRFDGRVEFKRFGDNSAKTVHYRIFGKRRRWPNNHLSPVLFDEEVGFVPFEKRVDA